MGYESGLKCHLQLNLRDLLTFSEDTHLTLEVSSEPLRLIASIVRPFLTEIRQFDMAIGEYAICVKASAVRSLEILAEVDAQWDNPLFGLLLPCLRPACEDLIALRYLLQSLQIGMKSSEYYCAKLELRESKRKPNFLTSNGPGSPSCVTNDCFTLELQ